MRLRSCALAALAAVVALGAVVAVTAGPSTRPAAAAGVCSVVAPTKVVLDRPAVEVPYRLGADCPLAAVPYASWDVIHPTAGPVGGLTFDGGTTDSWQLEDWMGPARYSVRPWSALAPDNSLVVQNSAVTTVKLGSRLTARIARADGRLTFAASARVWSPETGGWSARPRVNVSVMHRAPGSDTWTWVKAAATSTTGSVTLSVVPRTGSYRLMVKETDQVWAGYSATVAGR